MGGAKVHPQTYAHLPHHLVTWVSPAVSSLPLGHSMRGGGRPPVSCPSAVSLLTPPIIISSFSIMELLVTHRPVWGAALMTRFVFLGAHQLAAAPMPGLLLSLQFHLKKRKVLFSILLCRLSAVPRLVCEFMLWLQVKTERSPGLLPASCSPLPRLPATAVVVGTTLSLSFQVKAGRSPGPPLAGWFPLLPMAIAGLAWLRRPPATLRGGMPASRGAIGQRRGCFSALSPPARAPATTAGPAWLRNLLSGVTPGVLWAMRGTNKERVSGVRLVMVRWGQTHSTQMRELDARSWKCRQSAVGWERKIRRI